MSDSSALAPGTRLAPYEVVAPLGAGGMGEVYHARDPRLGRDVALKVVAGSLSGDAEARGRFEREARATQVLLDYPVNTVDIWTMRLGDLR